MLQVTFLRIIAIIILGIGLYSGLVHTVGGCESRHLKKRRKAPGIERENMKTRIILIYFFLLCSCIVLCFLAIRYFVRGKI